MTECSVSRCPRIATRRGMCDSHYRRVRRTGNAGGPIVPGERLRSNPSDLFWAKVIPAGWSECWEWTGSTSSSGYGQFKEYAGTSAQTVWTAHRFAYTDMVGEIPEGLQIDHLCRNILCVNPGHLEPVTAQENMRRTRRDACKRDHAFTPENTLTYPSGRKCRECLRLRYAALVASRSAA